MDRKRRLNANAPLCSKLLLLNQYFSEKVAPMLSTKIQKTTKFWISGQSGDRDLRLILFFQQLKQKFNVKLK